MPRVRWFVIGCLVAVALVGGALNERGPFGQHPSLSYAQFLADFQAGDVGQILQWRDQIEVTEADQLLLVTVPPDRDLTADLAQAKLAGSGGITWVHVPDGWMTSHTPWIPVVILVAAALIWAAAIARTRGVLPRVNRAGSRQPAG